MPSDCLITAAVRHASFPILGNSESAEDVRRLAKVAAGGEGDVLIVGDTGTGKEHVARAIHEKSARAGAFFRVDGASPAGVLDTELFGPKPAGSTLYLRDVAALSLPLQEQLRLARSQQSGDGGRTDRPPFTARLICSTSQDLPALVRQRLFDEALYEQVSLFTIQLAPLDSRREDIPLLLAHFLGVLRDQTAHPVERFSPAAEEVLMRRSWPGNLRELGEYVRATVEHSSAKVIEPLDLWLPLASAEPGAEPWQLGYRVLRKRVLLQFEADFVARVLKASGGNVSMAARLAQIDRKHLWRLIQRTGIRLERFGRPPVADSEK
jgi:two-component system, NtrC family, response regulator GlrR